MKAANPYLNFHGNTKEAFEFYRSVFGGEFLAVMRYKDFPELAMEVPRQRSGPSSTAAAPIGSVSSGWSTTAEATKPIRDTLLPGSTSAT